MTGFARATRLGEWGELELELRAVNHRFLDLKLVLPEPLHTLEEVLRDRLQAGLARGRIEASLRWRPQAAEALVVNRELAFRLAGEAKRLFTPDGDREMAGRLDVMRLLAWPGVVGIAAPEVESVRSGLTAVAETAIAGLNTVREREGAVLAKALEERLARLAAGVEACGARAREAKRTLSEQLAERIAALGTEVDPARIAQEAALLVVRQDTSEELERLALHAAEARRLLSAREPVGRRLDFLMQELMREANTLAAKAGNVAINRHALDFKVLIEEMREQVQNVE